MKPRRTTKAWAPLAKQRVCIYIVQLENRALWLFQKQKLIINSMTSQQQRLSKIKYSKESEASSFYKEYALSYALICKTTRKEKKKDGEVNRWSQQ